MSKVTHEGGGRKSVTVRDGSKATTYRYERGGLFNNYQYKGKTERRG